MDRPELVVVAGEVISVLGTVVISVLGPNNAVGTGTKFNGQVRNSEFGFDRVQSAIVLDTFSAGRIFVRMHDKGFARRGMTAHLQVQVRNIGIFVIIASSIVSGVGIVPNIGIVSGRFLSGRVVIGRCGVVSGICIVTGAGAVIIPVESTASKAKTKAKSNGKT